MKYTNKTVRIKEQTRKEFKLQYFPYSFYLN
jgi:hypothetical protein